MNLKKIISHITRYDKTTERLNQLSEQNMQIISQQQELLMAHKYHDTVADYEWLKYKGISPGGWAINYAFCYTLVRTLNAMHPQNILECGLGQSSRIVHQYAAYYGVRAVTCEHDEEWIAFLGDEIGNNYPINVQKAELEHIEYNGQRTLTYKNLSDIFNGKRFDLFVIDGPFGSPHYSRSQSIGLCRDNLQYRFCIIIDDTEREGEKETIEEIKKVLTEKGVGFSFADYSSTKSHTLICSKDLGFLTSL